MIPLCVITYKHPKYDFIDRVMKDDYWNSEHKFNRPLYYFIYDMDLESFNYDYYKDKFEELHFISVPYPEFKTCSVMRYFVQTYMTKINIDKFWFFDNDIGTKFMYKNWEIDRLGHKHITEILDEYENNPELDNYGLLGFQQNWHSILKKQEKDVVKGYVMQAFYVNNKLLNANGIQYQGDPAVAEDYEIMLNCKLHDVKYGVISKYVYSYVSPTNENGWYNVNKMVEATYAKYKDTGLIKIATNRKGALKLHLLDQVSELVELW